MLRRREQLLTVDCTAYNSVQSSQYRDFYLVKYNVNIPAFVVYDRDHCIGASQSFVGDGFQPNGQHRHSNNGHLCFAEYRK
jgi:hypothetical protein